jgi:hypothetical protein
MPMSVLVKAYHAYRGIIDEDEDENTNLDTELDALLSQDEEDRQREEIEDAVHHDLETEFNKLIDTLRGGNGSKKK